MAVAAQPWTKLVFASFSWFIAAGLGALAYYLVADRSRTYVDVDGEPIAVAMRH